jgi:hypothetical protein
VTRHPPSAETEQLARDLLDRARAETTQADNKAAILLAGVLAVAGGIAAAAGAGSWTPARLAWYVTVPFWAAAAAMLAAIACLAAAIYPRRRVQPSHELTSVGYFGDVAALGSAVELRGLLTDPGVSALDIWVDQIWQLSAIVSRKYQLVRWSVRLLGAALALAVIAAAASS